MTKRTIGSIADKWILSNLVLLIIGLPFSRAVIEIGLAGMLLGWVVYKAGGFSPQHTAVELKKVSLVRRFWVECGIGIPLAAFICVCLLSLVNSNYLYPQSLRGIIKVVKYGLFCLAVIDTVNSRKRFNGLIILFLAVAVVISLNGLVQYLFGTDLIRHYTLYANYRVSSSFGNPNDFSGYLCMLIPVSACLIFFRQKESWTKKILLIIVLCILSSAMILTYSKGAWSGLIISLAIIFVFQSKNKKHKLKKILFIIGSVAGLVMILFTITYIQNGDWLWDVVKKTASSRLYIWQAALKMIQNQPVLGHGINTFHAVSPFYRVNGNGGGYAHNCYIQMAAEIGLVGLTMFIWIVVSLFQLGLKGLASVEDRLHRAVLLGLLAGILGFLIHSMVDTNLYSLPLITLFWLFVGLTISLLRINNLFKTNCC